VKELWRRGRGGKRGGGSAWQLLHHNVIPGFLLQQNRRPRREAPLPHPAETKPSRLAGWCGTLPRRCGAGWEVALLPPCSLGCSAVNAVSPSSPLRVLLPSLLRPRRKRAGGSPAGRYDSDSLAGAAKSFSGLGCPVLQSPGSEDAAPRGMCARPVRTGDGPEPATELASVRRVGDAVGVETRVAVPLLGWWRRFLLRLRKNRGARRGGSAPDPRAPALRPRPCRSPARHPCFCLGWRAQGQGLGRGRWRQRLPGRREEGVTPSPLQLPPLLSCSSPCRAPSPASPSSRSSRKRPAAPQRRRPGWARPGRGAGHGPPSSRADGLRPCCPRTARCPLA